MNQSLKGLLYYSRSVGCVDLTVVCILRLLKLGGGGEGEKEGGMVSVKDGDL